MLKIMGNENKQKHPILATRTLNIVSCNENECWPNNNVVAMLPTFGHFGKWYRCRRSLQF